MGLPERYLMCPPEFFQVDYVINPWMEGNIDRANGALASEQWDRLHLILEGQGKIELITPLAGSPDMVFTANAGLVLGDRAVLSRFLHRERQSEEPHFRNWFQQHGFRVHELPKDLPFEGAGDALFDREQPLLWAGYGFRTELDTHALIAELLGVEVVSLRLIDKRFYHLDTCLCPLERGFLMYYPAAFDTRSNAQIEHRVPPEKRLILDETDAVHFAANAVNIGENLVLHRASDVLKSQLAAAGFRVFEAPLTEFIKSGGAARCLTLRLNELPKPGASAHSEIASRVLQFGRSPAGFRSAGSGIGADGPERGQLSDFEFPARQATSEHLAIGNPRFGTGAGCPRKPRRPTDRTRQHSDSTGTLERCVPRCRRDEWRGPR